MLIEGKIAKIIDSATVVINRGSETGVENGMKFIIYQKGEEIFDPDTGESLGFFEHIKAKIKVIQVNEKFSTARSAETEIINEEPNLYVGLYGQLDFLRTKTHTIIKKLPLDDSTISELKEPIVDTVQIGDLVREILD
jgi:hypothetical protein